MKKAEKDKLDDATKDMTILYRSLEERQKSRQRVSMAVVVEGAKVLKKLEHLKDMAG